MVYKHYFGRTPDGQAVTRFTLFNHNTMEVNLLNYGARLHSICVPDRDGNVEDILLGCDTPADYLASPYFGGTVGRCAGRIAGASLPLNGKEYPLTANDGTNHLHGGAEGFDARLWQWKTEELDNLVIFRYTSPAGEEGYPGEVEAEVSYCLTQEDALIIHYTVTAAEDTVINLTNHAYFNLNGQGRGDILSHTLELNAARFHPVGVGLIPTGESRPVAGTPFDFTVPHPIGECIGQAEEQLILGGGYDHDFLLDYDPDDPRPLHPAAELCCPANGRKMTVFTTEPALQLYTGNGLQGVKGKEGVYYGKHSGVCLETQHSPDSIHHPEWPTVILRAGETYESETVLFFGLME